MQFRNFVANVLGSETRIRVLLYLLGEPSLASEREIAGRLGVSNAAINKIMKDFHDANLVTPMRVGAAHIWRLNETSYAFQIIRGLVMLAKQPPLEHLKAKIISVLGSAPNVKKAVIFGSVAEGREFPQSDIDLFVIIDREGSRKKVSEVLSKLAEDCLEEYGNVLSPTVLTEQEVVLKKNKSLIEQVSKGIVVTG